MRFADNEEVKEITRDQEEKPAKIRESSFAFIGCNVGKGSVLFTSGGDGWQPISF